MSSADVLAWLNTVVLTMGDRPITLLQILSVPILLIVGFGLIRWGSGVLSRRLAARSVSPDLIHLVRRIFYIIALALLAFTTLDLLNVPLTAFAFVSGAIAIGVGFGAQNIINNFISGWILMWERPIRIGGNLRGLAEDSEPQLPDINRIAVEITASDFYSRTFTIDHR